MDRQHRSDHSTNNSRAICLLISGYALAFLSFLTAERELTIV